MALLLDMTAGIHSASHLNTAVDGSSVIFLVYRKDRVGALSFSTLLGMNSEVYSKSKEFLSTRMSLFLSEGFVYHIIDLDLSPASSTVHRSVRQ